MKKQSALQLAREIKRREKTVEETVREAVEAAERSRELNAFITMVEREQLMARAREVQAQIERGELDGSSLAGVPVAVKDNICTRGMRTTCGSRMLGEFVPAYSATAVERMERAGIIVIGKTNMDEFGMGSTSETSFFGAVKNPVDATRVAGGSSGGSAAAVAAGIVPLALGSDTGGSIRQPASHCGVIGLKPTYGSVSRYGLVAYASSMDQIGVIGRNAEDCAALFRVIAGQDPKDATSCESGASFRKETGDLTSDMNGMRIGVFLCSGRDTQSGGACDSGMGYAMDPEVEDIVRQAGRKMESLGAVTEEFRLDLTDDMVPAYYIIACAEASSNLERFDGVKYGHRAAEYEGLHDMVRRSRSEGFGEEVRRRIRLGTFVLSQGYYDEYYLQACRVRRLIAERFRCVFEKYNLILAPAAPTVAPRLGESLTDPIRMYMSDLFTVPANLAGLPAVSVPFGTADGLPVGVQLIGIPFSESKLTAVAAAIQRGADH